MLNTIEAITLLAAAVGGFFLGTCYFFGLWWTVCRIPSATQPLTLYFGSLVARLAVVLIAFYGVLASCGWIPLATALAGFLGSRIGLSRLVAKSV